jgi:hypothetical protein
VAKVRPWRGIPAFVGMRDSLFAGPGHHAGDPSDDAIAQAASTGWWSDPLAAAPTRAGAAPPCCAAPAAGPQQAMNDGPGAPAPADLAAMMRESFVKTYLGLRAHAASIGLDLADLGCTALGLLLNVESGRGVAGQVGDGAVLGLTGRGRVSELVEAPESEDLQSVFTINRPSFAEHLAIQPVAPSPGDPYVTYFAMTDGVASDLLYAPNPEDLDHWGQAVDHNLRTAASPTQASAAVLNWLATYRVKGSWDDRTLVVLTRRSRNEQIWDERSEDDERR